MNRIVTCLIAAFVIINTIFGSFVSGEPGFSSQCGPESLQLIAADMGISTNIEHLKELAGTTATGTSMLGLQTAAEALNLPAVPVKLTWDQYQKLNVPLIAWVDGTHYVVVWKSKWFGTKVEIQDPQGEKQVVPISEFNKRWNGEALAFSKDMKQTYTRQQEEAKAKRYSGAHAHFDNTVHFAGTINEGAHVSHVFRFTNTGSDTLRVYARSTCSCTATMMTNQLIPPQEEGAIEVFFDTTGRRGATQQSVDVKTNDSTQPWVTLVLAATVKNTVKTIPRELWFDEVQPEQNAERMIRILGADDNAISIRKIETPPSMSANIYPAATDSIYGYHIPIRVTLKTGVSLEEIQEQVTVVLDSGQRIDIPVSGNVVSKYRAYPPVAYFDNSSNESREYRDIDIVPRDRALDFVSSFEIELASDAVSATFIEHQPSKSKLRITSTVQPQNAIVDTLRLYESDQNIPVVEIPVFIAN